MLLNLGKKNAKEIAAAEERRQIIKEIHEINRKMAHAYMQFNLEQDEDLIEATIFMMQSLNARYRYLLKQVREEEATRQEHGKIMQKNRMVAGEWV